MMDSVFQIKINENKLQKILVQLTKNQNCLVEELAESKNMFNQNIDNQATAKKQFYGRIEEIDRKITANIQEISQSVKTNFKKCQETIAVNAQLTSSRFNRLEEIILSNSESFLQQKIEMEEKINNVNEKIEIKQAKDQEANQKQQTINPNLQQRLQKLQNLQKQMSKVSQLTSLLQNKNFLYFLHQLVGKQQQQLSKLPQSIRQIKNPLNHQPNEQKVKRYKQVKKILEQTHSKLQNMQSEYIGYFQTVSQGNKQNQENTHLHYAFLAARIKDLQSKISNSQTQNIYLDKIVYPSEGRREKFMTSRLRIQSGEAHSSRNINVKSKQEIIAIVKEEVEPLRLEIEKMKSDIKLKMQKIQDKFWSANNKIDNIRSNAEKMKLQIDKLKLSGHQQLVDKDGLVAKAGGLLNHFRNIQDQIEQKLKKKVDMSDYAKNSQQISQKLKIFAQQVQQKSNKQQTRKAFNFVQQKIRQIVTLLADMQNSSKKTAARKMMMQCLSCDDNFFEEGESRPITSKLNHRRNNSGLKLKFDFNADRSCRRSNM